MLYVLIIMLKSVLGTICKASFSYVKTEKRAYLWTCVTEICWCYALAKSSSDGARSMYRDLYRPSSIIAVSGVCWSISIFSKQLSHVISEDVNLHLSGSSRSINFVVDFLMEYIKRFACSVRATPECLKIEDFHLWWNYLPRLWLIQGYKDTKLHGYLFASHIKMCTGVRCCDARTHARTDACTYARTHAHTHTAL